MTQNEDRPAARSALAGENCLNWKHGHWHRSGDLGAAAELQIERQHRNANHAWFGWLQ